MRFFGFRQLTRFPIKTVLSLLLLSISAGALCFGFSLYLSAQNASFEINENFVTVIIPNMDGLMESELGETDEYGNRELIIDFEKIREKTDEIIKTLEEGENVKKDDRRMYLGAAEGVI